MDNQQLEQLFEQDLKPKLQYLETLRKKVWLYRILTLCSIIIVVIPFVLGNVLGDGLNIFKVAIFIAGIAALLYINNKAGNSSNEYHSKYKSEIVGAIVKAFNSDWTYSPDECISEREYTDSGLFTKQYDRYKGDDLVYGKIGQTDFRSSELNTAYKTVTRDSKGNKRTTWHTIFNGFFFHADFNKDFSGTTFVMPDKTEKILGSFARSIQGFSGKGKLVELENPDFENRFVVYSTDQTEARYILTPALMEALLSIKNNYKYDVYFSFVKSRVYCTIQFNKELLEPSVFSGKTDLNDIKMIYDIFKINETLITELNLNTRIWTKI